MVADETGGPGNGLLYTLLGALSLVVVGGGVYFYQNSENLLLTADQEPGRISALVDIAYAAIERHDYAAADRALDEAEHIDAHDPAVMRTRDELAAAAGRVDPRN
jgi:hypothetical protein